MKQIHFHPHLRNYASDCPCGLTAKKTTNKQHEKTTTVQLKQYETAPNFIQLTQNLTSDCWLV